MSIETAAPMTAQQAQAITIDSYNRHAEEYIRKDQQDDGRTQDYWPGVQRFLDQLPDHSEILEIGSGTGSDARRIEKQGYSVHRTEVAEAFIKNMRLNGNNVEHFNILEGAYKKQGAIFANAVFLHFTLGQFQIALRNAYDSLRPDGLLCLGMKLGDFEGWREEGLTGKRYCKYWQLRDLQMALLGAGFAITTSYETPAQDYAVITAKK